MNAIRRIPLAIALLAAGGCAVGPTYRRPAAPAQEAWKEAASAPAHADLLPGDWWRLFGDAELDALESQALEANQDLRRAVARVAEARALAGVTRSELYPSLSAGGSFTRRRTSQNGADVPELPGGREPEPIRNEARASLDAAYEIDVWGRVRRATEAADADLRAGEADLQVVQLTVAADLARGYHRLRALDSERATLDATAALRRDALRMQESRRKGGLITEIDVTRAQTELADVEAEIHAIDRERGRQEHALAVLCGRTAGGFAIAARRDALRLPEVPAGLPAALLARRPDVWAAERRLHAACARIGVAKAAFFPTFRLTGAAGAASAELGDLLDWPSRIWSLAPSVTLPIFTGGRNRANLAAAEARHEQALAAWRGAALEAFREVEDALGDLAALAAQDAAVGRSLAAARATATLAAERYAKGLSTYLEVVDAERGALHAERQQVRLRGQRAAATVQLIKSLGGGWEEPGLAKQDR